MVHIYRWDRFLAVCDHNRNNNKIGFFNHTKSWLGYFIFLLFSVFLLFLFYSESFFFHFCCCCCSRYASLSFIASLSVVHYLFRSLFTTFYSCCVPFLLLHRKLLRLHCVMCLFIKSNLSCLCCLFVIRMEPYIFIMKLHNCNVQSNC